VVAYAIVPLVALVGVGAVELAKLVPLRLRPPWLPALTGLLLVGVFGAFTRDQRVVLNSRSYAPFREVAEYLSREGKLRPINVIGYGLGGRVFQIYYPQSAFADTLADLDAEIEQAPKRGGPVYVMHGYRQFNEADARSASGAAKVSDPVYFEEVAAFPGIEPLFYFRVMRDKHS